MPAIRLRNPIRITSGLWLTSGSVNNRVTELRAGSVLVNSPSFGAGTGAASREEASVAVTGLTASHLVIVIPGSMPGACVHLISACAIADNIETAWGRSSCTGAAAGCAITLNYIAYRDST